MFKMLLIGYLYEIKSKRKLVEAVQLNIAYRWFCGFELCDKIPAYSKGRMSKAILFRRKFLQNEQQNFFGK